MTTNSDFARLDFDVTERRRKDDDLLQLIQEMFVELRQIREEGRQMRSDLHLHIQDEAIVLRHAFPQEDPDGHRRAHEAWIKKAENQAKFWETLYTTLKISGIVSVAAFLLVAGWTAFLKGPKQ